MLIWIGRTANPFNRGLFSITTGGERTLIQQKAFRKLEAKQPLAPRYNFELMEAFRRLTKSHQRKHFLNALSSETQKQLFVSYDKYIKLEHLQKHIESLLWRGIPHSELLSEAGKLNLPKRYTRAAIKSAARKLSTNQVPYNVHLPLFFISSTMKTLPPYCVIRSSSLKKIPHDKVEAIDNQLKSIMGASFREYDVHRLRHIYYSMTRRLTLLNIGDPKYLIKDSIKFRIASGNNKVNRNKGFTPCGLSKFGFENLNNALRWLDTIQSHLVWRDGYIFKVRGLKGTFSVTDNQRKRPSDNTSISRQYRIYPKPNFKGGCTY